MKNCTLNFQVKDGTCFAVETDGKTTLEAVLENGILLTGGGAELFGLDKMMRNVFKLPVSTMKAPDDLVARGLAAIASFLPVKMRHEGKDITEKIGELYTEYQSQKKKKND